MIEAVICSPKLKFGSICNSFKHTTLFLSRVHVLAPCALLCPKLFVFLVLSSISVSDQICWREFAAQTEMHERSNLYCKSPPVYLVWFEKFFSFKRIICKLLNFLWFVIVQIDQIDFERILCNIFQHYFSLQIQNYYLFAFRISIIL